MVVDSVEEGEEEVLEVEEGASLGGEMSGGLGFRPQGLRLLF